MRTRCAVKWRRQIPPRRCSSGHPRPRSRLEEREAVGEREPLALALAVVAAAPAPASQSLDQPMTAPQLTLATVAVIRPAMSEAMNVATLEPLELSIHPRARPPSRRAPPPDAPSVPPYDRPGEPATLLPGRKAPPTRSHAPPAATATVDRPPATHAASDKSDATRPCVGRTDGVTTTSAPANTRPSRSTSANP